MGWHNFIDFSNDNSWLFCRVSFAMVVALSTLIATNEAFVAANVSNCPLSLLIIATRFSMASSILDSCAASPVVAELTEIPAAPR